MRRVLREVVDEPKRGVRESVMFRQFEIVLTSVCLTLSVAFLVAMALRIRGARRRRNTRISIRDSEVGLLSRAAKLAMAVSIALVVPGVIYFLFVSTVPTAVVRPYAKTLFCGALLAWALVEIVLCFSVPKRLLVGWRPGRIAFFVLLVLLGAGAIFLFPNIPKSLPFPRTADCVVLDLPVHGLWLAGHGGASEITNGHWVNRYAIDILKLGADGRMYRGSEEAVTDFYSYDEPVYAPADGRVTEIVNEIESDVLGSRDRENPGGNYIIIDIGESKYVYLAHLKRGSIRVEPGEFVKAGALLGRVGNSGNSTHPHLHMHVQNKPTSEREGRVTYPFRFREMRRKRLILWNTVRNGYLIRNDWFTGTTGVS